MIPLSLIIAGITALASLLVATTWYLPGLVSFLMSIANLVCAVVVSRKGHKLTSRISIVIFLISVLVFAIGAYAKSEVDKETSREAERFQSQLCTNGKCIPPGESWEKSSEGHYFKHVKYFYHPFKIRYVIQPDQREFFVETRYSFDLWSRAIYGNLSSCRK